MRPVGGKILPIFRDFFFSHYFSGEGRKILTIFRDFFFFFFFFCKNEKKRLQSHIFQSPGRYTGNIIIFMDSLRYM